jgi:hypothetical protein
MKVVTKRGEGVAQQRAGDPPARDILGTSTNACTCQSR